MNTATLEDIDGIDVAHADEHLLVLVKPAGLLSVPGRGEDKQDCLATRVQARWPDALIVHRLDRDTSGLLVMARGAAVHRQLSMAFAAREVHKRYTAVVHGALQTAPDAYADGWGLIDQPLLIDWPNRPRNIVTPEGRPSRTRWRVMAIDATHDRTRVELEPITGRSHQLRVHLQWLGHPIVGDTLYAPSDAQTASPRLLLHAQALGFKHPVTGEALQFDSPAPF